MGQVVSIFATRADIEAAWEAYDAARIAELAAYQNEASAPPDRFALSMAVVRAHRDFTRLYNRWPEEASC